MSQSDKEMILRLLKQQLEMENRSSIEASMDDPGEFSDEEQANTSRLVVAIELLEKYEWEDFEESSEEIPF